MDVFWDNGEHTFHPAIDGLTAGYRRAGLASSDSCTSVEVVAHEHTILEHHCHGCTLIQNPQLPLGALLIARIGEDPAIQQGAICVRNHTPDIPRTVGFPTFAHGILQRVEILLHRFVPVETVPLVDAIYSSRLRYLHVRMRQDEFAQGVIHGEAIDAATLHREHQLGAGTVHCEAARDEFGAGEEDLFFLALGAFGKAEDAEDGAHADTGVEIAAAVYGVTDHGVSGGRVLIEDDTLLLFFRDEEATFARGAHGGDEEVVADDIKFLLVVACGVGGAGEAGEVYECGTADVVGDGFEGELEGVAEEGEVTGGFGVFGLFFGQEAGEGDDIGVDLLLGHGCSNVTIRGGLHCRDA